MDIRRRFLSKKGSGGSSGGDSSGTYTVNLNGQWEKTTAVTNPDSSLYDGVYRSTSNYNVHNMAAIMYIDISGLTSFKLYIRSYAESNYDYVMVSQLDQTINNNTSYSSTSLVKAHTRGNQQSGTALSSYTLVEFTGIDGGNHRITVVYRKDGSGNSSDDRGYVLIPKSSGSGGDSGGDVDIDTTYSIMYTSGDGNVVTPYATNVFGANITNNVYINGQGIITFDRAVTSIGNSAFEGCQLLTSITIPDSVTSIGNYAFYQCSKLTSITIPDRVTSIGNYAFSTCKGMTDIYFESGNISFGNYIFSKSSKLTKIHIDTLENWFKTSWYLNGSPFTSTRSLYINSVKFVEFPKTTSSKSIGNSCFAQNKDLIKINIPDGIATVGDYAFFECSNCVEASIPSTVTNLGIGVFRNCTSITDVYCYPTTPPNMTESIFVNVSNFTIYVPRASLDAYKSASVWSDYADYIVGYDFNITFYVESDNTSTFSYTADAGMTWQQFVNSEYNPVKSNGQKVFTIQSGEIYWRPAELKYRLINASQDTIIESQTYVSRMVGGSGGGAD